MPAASRATSHMASLKSNTLLEFFYVPFSPHLSHMLASFPLTHPTTPPHLFKKNIFLPCFTILFLLRAASVSQPFCRSIVCFFSIMLLSWFTVFLSHIKQQHASKLAVTHHHSHTRERKTITGLKDKQTSKQTCLKFAI